ncbi:MAG TPA: tRNA pseudouridine(55) synthase TruB [Bryobacteraceae bacterium]|nr:tRNA pseudouridine(55) synthase TruB [Bryobacteraceae bacterium]
MTGAIIVDKPAGWTSHDVVGKLRRLTGIRRIGHLGTLDPPATGVLPLLVGRATRLAQYFGRGSKRYEGTVRFGFTTDTWDAAGEPTSPETEVSLDCGALAQECRRFVGTIQQVPPPVSAKKVAGVPAYKLARKNQAFDLPACEVEIYSLQVTRCEGREADIDVRCSGGTYLRSIAHELGNGMSCGAHLKSLRRTESNGFTLAHARTIEQLETWAAEDRMIEALIPARELLPDMPSELVDPSTANFIRQGRSFRVSAFRPATVSEAPLIKAVDASGDLIAIGEAKLPNLYQPVLVL